jgi:hypothetical protein
MGDGGLFIDMKSPDPNNHPRNFRIVKTNNVHPVLDDKFVASLQHVSVLRFMDWLQTNNSTKSNVVPEEGSIGEVTPEMIVSVCNALQKHAWINIPHLATASYVDEFIRRWNSMFSQAAFCETQGVALNLETNRWLAGMYYHAQKTVELGAKFKQAFGSRVQTVLGAFAANDWFTDNMLRYPGIAPNVDLLAIAPYFGRYTSSKTVDAIMAEVPACIEDARNYIRNTKRWVDLYPNIRIAAYEGGQHFLIENHDDTYTQVLKQVNEDPRMGPYYAQYLEMWKQETNDALFVHFVNTGRWSKWGCWGSMRNLSDTASPKYQALIRFASST